jgi:hypothetical protein
MRSLVLAMTLLGCTGSDDADDDLGGSPCAAEPETYEVALDTADAELRFSAERCEVDASTCMPFCMQVVNAHDPSLYVRSCTAEVSGNTATVMAQVSRCPPDVGPVDAGIFSPD